METQFSLTQSHHSLISMYSQLVFDSVKNKKISLHFRFSRVDYHAHIVTKLNSSTNRVFIFIFNLICEKERTQKRTLIAISEQSPPHAVNF